MFDKDWLQQLAWTMNSARYQKRDGWDERDREYYATRLGRQIDIYQEDWVAVLYTRGEWTDMSKNRWVDITLDKDDKKAVRKLADDGGEVLKLFRTAIDAGYRVSVTYSKNDKCCVATVSPMESNFNKGLITNARAKGPVKALACVLYKVGVMRSWEGWEAEDEGEDDFMS